MGALSTVSAFNHERAPTSCLQQIEAIEANNWTQNNAQRNHQRFRSRVLMAHDDSEHNVARGAHRNIYVLLRKDALSYLISAQYYTMFLTRDIHGARGRASQTPHEVRSMVGARSSKL